MSLPIRFHVLGTLPRAEIEKELVEKLVPLLADRAQAMTAVGFGCFELRGYVLKDMWDNYGEYFRFVELP